MAKELADLLGAQLACTRPMVEGGWFGPKKQIGLSGRTVNAKLIITLGVSGSVQFAAGMAIMGTVLASFRTSPRIVLAAVTPSITGMLDAPFAESGVVGIGRDNSDLHPRYLLDIPIVPSVVVGAYRQGTGRAADCFLSEEVFARSFRRFYNIRYNIVSAVVKAAEVIRIGG